MSLNLNQVVIAGRLTRDPEVKTLANERCVAKLGVAVNRKWKGNDGVAKEEVTFVDVDVWGKTAEHCGQYLHKGSAVFIEGRLKSDEWQTKDGEKRRAMKVEANNVQFLDPAAPAESQGPQPEPVKRTVTTATDPFGEEPPF